MKVGHKARRNRKRSPAPHKSHHRTVNYDRVGRLLKQRIALPYASGVHISPITRGRAVAPAGPMTRKD